MKPDKRRLFDLTAASVLLLAGAPVWPVLAVLVKISSPGPIFCRRRAFSRGGRTIWTLRFRATIAVQNGGPMIAVTGARRLTPVGKFLRRTGLEAWPQLFNVLRGDYSLTGPPLQTAEDGALPPQPTKLGPALFSR